MLSAWRSLSLPTSSGRAQLLEACRDRNARSCCVKRQRRYVLDDSTKAALWLFDLELRLCVTVWLKEHKQERFLPAHYSHCLKVKRSAGAIILTPRVAVQREALHKHCLPFTEHFQNQRCLHGKRSFTATWFCITPQLKGKSGTISNYATQQNGPCCLGYCLFCWPRGALRKKPNKVSLVKMHSYASQRNKQRRNALCDFILKKTWLW